MKVTEVEKDALFEITDISTYKASKTISELIGLPLKLEIIKKEIVSLDSNSYSEKEHIPLLAVYSPLKSADLRGNIVMIFEKNSALLLIDILLNRVKGTTKFINDEAKDIITEVGNIISGKYMEVLSEMLDIDARHGFPSIVPSFGNLIYDYISLNLSDDERGGVLINNKMKLILDDDIIFAESILLFSPDSFLLLKEKMGNMVN
jgi:chemotaxis protein CheC